MLNDFSPDNDGHRNKIICCLEIMNDYLNEEILYEEAKSRLITKKSSTSDFLIGELAIEECYRQTPDRWSFVSSYLEVAKASYSKVVNNVRKERSDVYASNKLRSGLRLAQLPTLEPVLKLDKIPDLTTFTSMYSKIINLGDTTLKTYPEVFRDKHDTTIEVKGVLGEIAFLALAQRHSLREVNGEGWLPLQSFFSQDHGGDCLQKTDGLAWDMTIFTQYDPSHPLESTYKIQDKLSFVNPTTRVCNDITTVGIYPDLQIRQSEHSSTIVRSIIAGCKFEFDAIDPTKAERITRDLDKRTEKLLEIID